MLEQHHRRGQIHSDGEFAPDGGFLPEMNGHDHVFQMRRIRRNPTPHTELSDVSRWSLEVVPASRRGKTPLSSKHESL
jgi:hypothetical protein